MKSSKKSNPLAIGQSPKMVRNSKRKFSLSHQLSQRRLSVASSEEMKWSKNSSRILNLKQHGNQEGDASGSFMSDSSESEISIRQLKIPAFRQQQLFLDRDSSHVLSHNDEFQMCQLDMSSAFEQSILQIQFVNVNPIFSNGDSQIQSQSELFPSYGMKKSHLFNRNSSQYRDLTFSNDGSQSIDMEQQVVAEEKDELIRKYRKAYDRNPFLDPYYVKLVDLHGLARLKYEINNYNDSGSFLKARKLITYYTMLIPVLSKIITTSTLFKLFMTLLIFLHAVLFVVIYTNLEDDHLELQKVILGFYFVEIGLRIFSCGLLLAEDAFLKNFQNLFDTTLVVLITIKVYYPETFSLDVSPLRLFTLLIYLGDIIDSLNLVLTSIRQSFRFLLEALAIVGLFSIFFAIAGLGLFHGLFHYRCLPLPDFTPDDSYDPKVWIQCNQERCPDGFSCQRYFESVKIPTKFDDIVFSFGQVIRLTTKDDWTVLMFHMLRIYHPWAWLFPFFIIFIGGFFGFNLVIAVLKVHYSEANEQDRIKREQKEIEANQKKNNPDPERDFLNTYDVAFLRYIEFYDIIKKYKQMMSSNYPIKNYNQLLPEKVQKSNNQPRLLSAKQKRDEESNDSFRAQLRAFFQLFSIKYMLLPKLALLHITQQHINIKQYSEDQCELDVMKRLVDLEFSQLSPELNTDIRQTFDSTGDILKEYENPIIIRLKEHEQQYAKLRKTKVPVVYPEFHLANSIKPNANKLFSKLKPQFPFARSYKLRSNIVSKRISIVQDDDDGLIQFQSRKSFKMKQSAANHNEKEPVQRQSTKDGKPFAINKENKIKIYVQGYYLGFEEMQNKINQKLEKRKHKEPELEFKYRQTRLNEMDEKRITQNIWSGHDVLLNINQHTIKKFQYVFYSLKNQDARVWITGIKGALLLSQKYAFRVVYSQASQLFFDIVIFINFLFMALQGIAEKDLINQIENVVTFLLCVEAFLKLYSKQLKILAENQREVFDVLVVSLNFIEIAFHNEFGDVSEQNIRLIRGTKCMLFYRCLKYNKMASMIGQIASQTLSKYIALIFLLFWVILIWALIGMGMYSGRFDQNDFTGLMHSFDNVIKAFMTIFNIMTNDWYAVFTLGCNISIPFAMIYNFTQVIIINCLTFGLVMAILLDSFGKFLDKELAQEEEDELQQQNKEQEVQMTEEDEFETLRVQHRRFLQLKSSLGFGNTHGGTISDRKPNLIVNLIKQIKQLYKEILEENPKIYDKISCQQSLYMFDKSNRLRVTLAFIVQSTIYKCTTIIVIFLSLIAFSLQTYNDYEILIQEYPLQIQLVCNIYLLIHFIFGCIAQGLCMDQGCYLQSSWQLIDLAYIISYMITYGQNINNQPKILIILNYLGYLRTFKILYILPWIETVRVALGRATLDILKVFVTLFSVWIFFAVYGIILHQNQFGFCEDQMQFDVNFTRCLEMNKTWVNYRHNFDNITIALPTLFVISTFDYWGEIMAIAESSQVPEIGPQAFNSMYQADIFFILFQFIGSMFFISFVTGILYSNLKSNQKKLETGIFSQTQMEFKQIAEKIIKDFPVYSTPPNNQVRRLASDIINNKRIMRVMYILVILDSIVQMMFHSYIEDDLLEQISLIHHGLTLIFVGWLLLSYLALGINRFFDDGWRQYYFVVSAISLLDLILDYTLDWVKQWRDSNPNTENYQILRFFFMTRCFRVVLIFQGLANIQRLMRVMAFAVPFLTKIFTILMVTIFTYAFIGCQLFGHIDKGMGIDDQVNFSNIAQALLTLFKCASGDQWRAVMIDTMHHNPYCKQDVKYCGSDLNQLYFISYMTLITYVLLNLFVTGLIEQFESFFQVQNSLIQTYIENIDKVKTVWCRYSADTEGQSMHYKFLCKFLLDIGQPLGGGPGDNLWDVAKIASGFKLKCDHYGYIQYNQLIYELFRKCFQEAVFKEGSPESIKAIKQYNKEMQLRLMYYRRNRSIPRQKISPSLHLKANFNILHDYLTVLILYKSWETYSQKLMKQVLSKRVNFSENDELSIDENRDCMDADEVLEEENMDSKKQCVTEPFDDNKQRQPSLSHSDDFKLENIPIYKNSERRGQKLFSP